MHGPVIHHDSLCRLGILTFQIQPRKRKLHIVRIDGLRILKGNFRNIRIRRIELRSPLATDDGFFHFIVQQVGCTEILCPQVDIDILRFLVGNFIQRNTSCCCRKQITFRRNVFTHRNNPLPSC